MNSTDVRAAALIVLVLSGCGEPLGVPRDPAASIQTDRLEYRLIRRGIFLETRIDYAYGNSGTTPVFIQNCSGAYGILLEQFRDGEWKVVWGNATPDCLSPAIEIAPGQEVSGRLLVSAGVPSCECGGFATAEIDGVYPMVVT